MTLRREHVDPIVESRLLEALDEIDAMRTCFPRVSRKLRDHAMPVGQTFLVLPVGRHP